jgi:hypothetical protein
VKINLFFFFIKYGKLATALKYFEEFLWWLDDYRRNGFHSAVVTAIEMADEMDMPREFEQIRLR